MANPLDYILTKHAVDRLCERNRDFSISVESRTPAIKLREAYNFMAAATEEKSFLNNSIFMTMLGEKYGFDNCYTLFVRDNNVFVGVSNPRGRYIVTVMNRDSHYLPHIRHKVQKFQKKEKESLPIHFPAGRRHAR